MQVTYLIQQTKDVIAEKVLGVVTVIILMVPPKKRNLPPKKSLIIYFYGFLLQLTYFD